MRFSRAVVKSRVVILIVAVALTVPALIKGKLSRWQGIALLATYVVFCIIQFTM